jgi:DNA modification methylase
LKPLTNAEKAELKKLIDAGGQLPDVWMTRLFPGGVAAQATQDAIGKEYRLVYEGKLTREEVLAQTPAAPWQLVRSFCDERPFEDGWQNLLVWGDNLLAMRELLADQRGPNRFGTRDKIKLVYIDPPFATRQDFMKDKEKAYRDKVAGAKFLEFLRRRLIVLRELLAEDGSIFVHLDWKKGHYAKAILDEVFGESNFRNEIAWQRTYAHSDASRFGIVHDMLFFYSKSDSYIFNKQVKGYSASYIESHYSQQDADGRRFRLITMTGAGPGPARMFVGKEIAPPSGRHWTYRQSKIDELLAKKKIVFVSTGQPNLKVYLDESDGAVIQSIWQDIPPVNPVGRERTGYPTQKPEQLLERIISACSNPGDIVLDCFAGSGTTISVAEKLKRRWIGMDCGKLAIYTAQKRLFNLTDQVGSAKNDSRRGSMRVDDWPDHEKKSRLLLFVTEKARKGECDVTVELLKDLASLAQKNSVVDDDTPISIVCPEDKLKIQANDLYEPDEGPGTKAVSIDGIEFRISFIAPKEKAQKEQVLPAKQFVLYRAGVYDMEKIQTLPWESYRPFVMKLFGVREALHTRYGFSVDGYVRGDAAIVWNYPENLKLRLDREYVADLHKMVHGKPGERIYVIAPVIAMGFMEDEVQVGKTTYVFLKVPVSVLMRLIENGAPAALPQPMKEDDVNEVIDAVGFDFVSQPLVEYSIRKSDATDGLLKSFVVEIAEFRAQTLATDADDFRNFETLSMVMLDLNYDGDVFRVSEVHWGEDLLKEAGGLDSAARLTITIPEENFIGDRMMMILCDRYGNEKALAIEKSEFKSVKRDVKVALAKKASAKKSSAKKSTKKKASGGSR